MLLEFSRNKRAEDAIVRVRVTVATIIMHQKIAPGTPIGRVRLANVPAGFDHLHAQHDAFDALRAAQRRGDDHRFA
jgi:hypothetical protein